MTTENDKKILDYIKQSKPILSKIYLKKETEFQETPIGKIPKDWKMSKLFQLINYEKGKKPSKLFKEDEKKPNYIPYLKAEYLRGLEKPEWCEPNDPNILKVEKTDIIMIWDGSSGEVFTGVEGALASTMIKIIPKDAIINNKYLYYWLKKYHQTLHSTTVGTGIPHINRKVFENLLIPIPSIIEQRIIAEILSTVDSVIDRVRRLVERAERLKKGLMQELFTKGIGHKEYKETPIGKIPKDWKVVKLCDVAEIRGNKSINNVNKIAFIPMELISDSEVFVRYEIRDLDDVSSFTYCEAGDILLAKITPSFENGKQGIVPDDVPNKFALTTTEVYSIVCKHVNRLFLFYILKHPKFRKILEHSMRGTTGRRRVPRDALENLLIPTPPLTEQKVIAEVLYTVDEYIRTLIARLERLERVKKWLMDVLLTGKVRVMVEPSSGDSNG